jgi:hypothetical protein
MDASEFWRDVLAILTAMVESVKIISAKWFAEPPQTVQLVKNAYKMLAFSHAQDTINVLIAKHVLLEDVF